MSRMAINNHALNKSMPSHTVSDSNTPKQNLTRQAILDIYKNGAYKMGSQIRPPSIIQRHGRDNLDSSSLVRGVKTSCSKLNLNIPTTAKESVKKSSY